MVGLGEKTIDEGRFFRQSINYSCDGGFVGRNPEYRNYFDSMSWKPARLGLGLYPGGVGENLGSDLWKEAGLLLAGSLRRYDLDSDPADQLRNVRWEPVNLLLTGSLGVSDQISLYDQFNPRVWEPSPLVFGGVLGQYGESVAVTERLWTGMRDPTPLVLGASLGTFDLDEVSRSYNPFRVKRWTQPQVLLGETSGYGSLEDYQDRFRSGAALWENVGLMFGGVVAQSGPILANSRFEPPYWQPINNPIGFSPGRYDQLSGTIYPSMPWFENQVFPKIQTQGNLGGRFGMDYSLPGSGFVDISCGMPLNIQGTMVYNVLGNLIGELGPGSMLLPFVPPHMPNG